MNWIVTKYKSEWSLYDKESKAYVLFGTKKNMEARAKELNSTDVKKHAKGSAVESVELMGGQPNSSKPSGYFLLEVKNNGKQIIVSDDGGKTKERYSKSNGFSGYTLHYKGNQYEFTDSYAKGSTIGVGDFSVWEIVKGNPKKIYTGSEMGAKKFAKKYNSTMPKDGRGLETWDAKATEEQVAKHHQSTYGTATSQEYSKGGNTPSKWSYSIGGL